MAPQLCAVGSLRESSSGVELLVVTLEYGESMRSTFPEMLQAAAAPREEECKISSESHVCPLVSDKRTQFGYVIFK